MAKTFKEYEKENTIICPNCHIQIKTNIIPMSMFDNIYEDMYIFHEDEYLERKALQQRIDKAIEYIENNKKTLNKNDVKGTRLKVGTFMWGVDDLLDILRGEEVKDKPEYLGYSDKECINCGRLRVEKYSDGTEICEKCNFDQNKKEYVLRDKDIEEIPQFKGTLEQLDKLRVRGEDNEEI